MQNYTSAHQFILQKSQKLLKQITRKDFCEAYGIDQSKLSRFPSDKFIDELLLFDHLRIEAGEKPDIIDFEE